MDQAHEVPGRIEEDDNHDSVQVEPESEQLQLVKQRIGNLRKRAPQSGTAEESLAPGLSDEDLWMLIRRFNKQIYHVRATTDIPPLELDLNRTEDEQYPPEKLRITIERFYTSVVVGVVSFFKHIARLRSWKEPRRTTVFCAAYFVAWSVDLLVPAILSVLVVLIWSPRIRPVMFPPDPRVKGSMNAADESQATGESTSPDGLTGAPERHKGETAEQEASQLVDSLASVAIQGAAAKYGQTVPEDAPAEEPGPDTPEAATATIADAQTETSPADNQAEKPMKKKVSKGTDEVMRVASDIADMYEKLANALSPTPPFSARTVRLQLVGLLASISLVSLVPSYWMVKATAFAIGFGFFGDPVIQHLVALMDEDMPDWMPYINLTLLKGIPTNAQLTLTLLRMGEVDSAPLPPPPSSQESEPTWPMYRKKFKTLTGLEGQDQDAPADLQQQAKGALPNPPKKSKRIFFTKVFRFMRRTIGSAIQGHAAFDRAIAIAGAAQTNNLLGMLHTIGGIAAPAGPLKFDGKYQRKRGAVVVDSTKEPPILYFTTYQSSGLDDLRLESRKKGSVLFQLPVTDIKELKKTEGLGWKGKLIVELTAGSKESVDGLVISGPELEQSYHITGMRERNQLFNRLVAIGMQFWESR